MVWDSNKITLLTENNPAKNQISRELPTFRSYVFVCARPCVYFQCFILCSVNTAQIIRRLMRSDSSVWVCEREWGREPNKSNQKYFWYVWSLVLSSIMDNRNVNHSTSPDEKKQQQQNAIHQQFIDVVAILAVSCCCYCLYAFEAIEYWNHRKRATSVLMIRLRTLYAHRTSSELFDRIMVLAIVLHCSHVVCRAQKRACEGRSLWWTVLLLTTRARDVPEPPPTTPVIYHSARKARLKRIPHRIIAIWETASRIKNRVN